MRRVGRDRGVDNVEFVWIMTDWSFHVPPTDRRHASHWYPGDDVVDHIAADAYNWSTANRASTSHGAASSRSSLPSVTLAPSARTRASCSPNGRPLAS